VIDRGPGIPEKQKKMLFQPFSKLDSPSHEKKVASTGLGLAITRKMVVALGGTISFTSSTDEDKHGTEFTILLPFEYDDSPATELQFLNPKLLSLSNSHHITDSTSPLESFVDQRIDFCSVVIAEDNVINANIIARLLRQSKDLTFSITTVGNGKELVDTMNNWKGALPNIILTDLHMPVMDGITAATIIREKYPSIKIALLTGDIQELKTSKTIDRVLLKPVSGDKLRKCVKDLLNSE
jgi:CheY-like chemotaxis protein